MKYIETEEITNKLYEAIELIREAHDELREFWEETDYEEYEEIKKDYRRKYKIEDIETELFLMTEYLENEFNNEESVTNEALSYIEAKDQMIQRAKEFIENEDPISIDPTQYE